MTIGESLLFLGGFCIGYFVGRYTTLFDKIDKRREKKKYEKLNRDFPYE